MFFNSNCVLANCNHCHFFRVVRICHYYIVLVYQDVELNEIFIKIRKKASANYTTSDIKMLLQSKNRYPLNNKKDKAVERSHFWTLEKTEILTASYNNLFMLMSIFYC